jgi:precorrin-6Y C5,15-methyltransferase (decarboxylating)
VTSGSGAITVVGLAGDRPGSLCPEALDALQWAQVVAGRRPLLDVVAAWPLVRAGPPEELELGDDVESAVREVRRRAVEQGQRVCVLSSGDPGYFGIVRALVRQVDRHAVRVLPAPSAVSLAFARLGLPWDDAAVLSLRGRSLADAVGAARTAPKVAVLTVPECPPEALGRALRDAGVSFDLVAVCSRLGTEREAVCELDLEQLAQGGFDAGSVVVLVGPGGLPLLGWGPGPAEEPGTGAAAPTPAWPDEVLSHRTDTINRAEVRAVVMAQLALPAAGVLWDIGTGSGSVALECAQLRPGLTVLAVEQTSDDAARASANAAARAVGVHVVSGRLPEVLEGLPDPDRAFVGGGGLTALRAVLDRLRPGGRVAATFDTLDDAVEAAGLLGHVSQLSVSRGHHESDRGWRLEATDPVFVTWGP